MNSANRYRVKVKPKSNFNGYIGMYLTPYVEDPDSKNLIFGDDTQILLTVSLSKYKIN